MATFERITHRAMAVAAVGEVTNTNHFVSQVSRKVVTTTGGGGHPPQTQTHDQHLSSRTHAVTQTPAHAHTRTRTLGCARLSTLNMNAGVSSNGRALCTCASRSGSVVCAGSLLLLLTVQCATSLAAVLSICCSRSAHLSAPLLSSRG
jgi:hypothetical protein